MIEARAGLAAIKSYSVEEAGWRVKLDANERAGELPPAVAEELGRRLAAVAVNRYPEITQHSLKEMLAAGFSLSPDNIAVGNGSSEVLAALCHAFGGAGRTVVFPSPSFSMYRIYTQLADSRPVTVELDDAFNLDPAAMVAAANRENASLVLLCNPNNPTGNTLAPAAVEQVVAGAGCPVVVDEAYCEFYGQSAVNLLAKYDNLVIVRTFSKAYGLAAARVGYGLASPAIAALVNKVLLPYHVNALSLTAAAVAWQRRDEFAPGIARTVAERGRMAAALAKLPGLEVFDSATNFLLMRTAKAAELNNWLTGRSIGTRDFGPNGRLAGCLRVTVGTADENDIFLTAVNEFFAGGVKA